MVGSRRSAGFTLVEAIVVAVIVGVLAAVAIPTYSSYVKKQKRDVARNLARTASVSANLYLRRNGVLPTTAWMQANLFLTDPTRYTVAISASDTAVVVTDVSSPPPDTIKAQAFFK